MNYSRVPELMHHSEELDSALSEEHSDSFQSSCPSIISVQRHDEGANLERSFVQGMQMKNSEISKIKKSNLDSMISLLDFQANNLSNPRQFVTTLWNFDFDIIKQVFRFSITDLVDFGNTGFNFVVISIKLPRNKPCKWEHYITNTTYVKLSDYMRYEMAPSEQPLTPLKVQSESQEILKRAWILDVGEVEDVLHTLDDLLVYDVRCVNL